MLYFFIKIIYANKGLPPKMHILDISEIMLMIILKNFVRNLASLGLVEKSRLRMKNMYISYTDPLLPLIL